MARKYTSKRKRTRMTRRRSVKQRGGEITLTARNENRRGFVAAMVKRDTNKNGCLPPPGWFSTWSRSKSKIYYEPIDGSTDSVWINPAKTCTPVVLPPVGWRLVNKDDVEVFYENPVSQERVANL
jgi:hypothetical protein